MSAPTWDAILRKNGVSVHPAATLFPMGSPALFFLLVGDREGLVAQRELSLQSDNHPDQSRSRRMLRRKLL